jgi:uncharacterized membrane protein YcaP (DUF421 family)
MGGYPTIFDAVPWPEVGITALQSFVIYWFALTGLKLVGRRAFGEMGPQDLILLLLLSESLNMGLIHNDAGFWGSLASALVLLLTVAIVERVPFLRQRMDDGTIKLVENGRLIKPALKKSLVEEQDLQKAAREYGMPSIKAFETMTLEGDGRITGVLKPEYRPRAGKAYQNLPL